jgi:hypothetical protein
VLNPVVDIQYEDADGDEGESSGDEDEAVVNEDAGDGFTAKDNEIENYNDVNTVDFVDIEDSEDEETLPNTDF